MSEEEKPSEDRISEKDMMDAMGPIGGTMASVLGFYMKTLASYERFVAASERETVALERIREDIGWFRWAIRSLFAGEPPEDANLLWRRFLKQVGMQHERCGHVSECKDQFELKCGGCEHYPDNMLKATLEKSFYKAVDPESDKLCYICDECSKKYEDWHIPDEYWKTMDEKYWPAYLCFDCYLRYERC